MADTPQGAPDIAGLLGSVGLTPDMVKNLLRPMLTEILSELKLGDAIHATVKQQVDQAAAALGQQIKAELAPLLQATQAATPVAAPPTNGVSNSYSLVEQPVAPTPPAGPNAMEMLGLLKGLMGADAPAGGGDMAKMAAQVSQMGQIFTSVFNAFMEPAVRLRSQGFNEALALVTASARAGIDPGRIPTASAEADPARAVADRMRLSS